MHGQHEVAKGTGLHRQLKQADAAVAAAQAHLDAQRAAQRAYEAQSRHPRGRPPAFAAQIEAALTALVAAEAEQTQAQARQTEARELIRELGHLDHPYDVETGQVQSVEQVAARFAAVWARLSRLADAVDLPTRARERIAKAQRLTVHWLAYLSFFFATLQVRVEALDLPADLEQALFTQLVPALYLERVAARSPQAGRPATEWRRSVRSCSNHCASRRIRSKRCRSPPVNTTKRSPAAAPICSSAAAPAWRAATVSSPSTIMAVTACGAVSSRH